ncbi:MAG: EAL domain-containing protein [Steroidobacteraceae bacterium]
MANILVVDDNPTNRKLLSVLLRHEGHETLEATDGEDGLAAARAERPQLVISDILMPSMDGYEFVRRLRSDPELGDIPVIFYTAHYHEREARALAQSCGVARVLVKPCPVGEILGAVERSLTGQPEMALSAAEADFTREHLKLLTNKLSEKATALQAANLRLQALTELNVQLASERDPQRLLDQVCRSARQLIGARTAVLAVAEHGDAGVSRGVRYAVCGIEASGGIPVPRLDAGLLGRVQAQQRALRACAENDQLLDTGLPAGYGDAHSFLAVPVASSARAHGWLCLLDKVGSRCFDASDEHVLAILGAQVGRIYENDCLYAEIERHAAQLAIEIEERKLAARKIEQLNRVYAVLSSINSLIVRVTDRAELLREVCRLAVEEGKFRLVWCGWCNGGTPDLRVVAFAGEKSGLLERQSIRIDGSESGESLLSLAWRTRQPQICNDIATEPRAIISRADLLARGFRSIAVLPFNLDNHFVGCLNLLSDERDFFDAAEVRLLSDLAGDISFALDHIEKSERLSYLAYYDAVTGLANRTLFLERLALQASGAAREGHRLALVVEQLERIDAIHDTLGRSAGEQLMRQLGERLVLCVGDPAAVARISPDRFAVILLRFDEERQVAQAIDAWRQQWLGTPYRVLGQEVTVSATVGAAVFPGDGRDADTLLKNAEAALNKARDSGDTHIFYTQGLSEGIAERISLESSMRGALQRQEFVLYYQPKVDLRTRRITGLEALLRWQNPDLGFLPPDRFVPLMEENGMIVDVGAWALRRAIQDRALWSERSLVAPRIAVNVSAVQIRRAGFVGMVGECLRLAGRDPGIDIEITESVIMDSGDNIQKLTDIRDLGIGIALDDFGTGYSSLGYLTRMPVETLKIDRSFIATMADDAGSMTLVSSIISLAHNLKLNTVAEGVETEDQAKLLAMLRCDQIQGYLVSKPLPFDDMTAFLSRTKK